MAQVVFTASADADSGDILADLVAKAGAAVAERYDAEFDALYRRLQQFPEIGSPRPALGRLVRVGIISPYVVVHEYFEADDTVVILRIVHGRRKLTRRMLPAGV